MLVRVKVKAGARKELVNRISAEHFEIAVKEKAEGGHANHRVLMLVALKLGVPASKLRIVKGHHHSSKLLEIR